jgi:hypothetical protein
LALCFTTHQYASIRSQKSSIGPISKVSLE